MVVVVEGKRMSMQTATEVPFSVGGGGAAEATSGSSIEIMIMIITKRL